MNKHDHLGLDGYTLRTFITVLEEASVSKAALRLGVSQSAVSHTLDRLRLAFDDALFVRDGRGIIPTVKATSLREPIESILNNIKSLTEQREFDPLVDSLDFTIATNDFPMLLIFPRLIKKLQSEGIKPRFHFMPAGVPSTNLSRTSRWQFLISPAPPKAKDIIQVRLFQSKMVCFYDAKIRQPPKSWKQFAESNYAEVKFSDTESSIMVLPSIDSSTLKTPTISVPNFSALNAFIKGSDLITTQLELMKQGPLKGLDSAPLPIKTQPVSVYLAWHQRNDSDPAHKWLRQKIKETVNLIFTEK
jgi:DNA-binding transcriptional LysR family regulator